jgi:hypothetical protein
MASILLGVILLPFNLYQCQETVFPSIVRHPALGNVRTMSQPRRAAIYLLFFTMLLGMICANTLAAGHNPKEITA